MKRGSCSSRKCRLVSARCSEQTATRLTRRLGITFPTELDGLVKQSRNHASVVSYSMSSELVVSDQADPEIVQLLQPGTHHADEATGSARAGHRLHRLSGLR